MNFAKRPAHTKAIKQADRLYMWLHLGICAVYGVWCVRLLVGPVTSPSIVAPLSFAVGVFGNLALRGLRRRRTYRRAMAAQYMLCDDCLYDLREVTTPVCPECGKEFTRSSLRRAWLWEAHARRRFRQRWGWGS